MFFPDRIRSIGKNDKVLEVGPGNTPFYRSNVLLEKNFKNEEEAFLQAGATKKKDLKKEIVYYEGNSFPFKEKEFDYVICSHVLEHIPKNDLDSFISEISRVSSAGYLEVPLYNFELLANVQYHLSLIYIDKNNKIHFLFKEDIDLMNVAYMQLRSFLENSRLTNKIIPLNLEKFGNGFEFKNRIDYIVHENIDTFFSSVDNSFSHHHLRLYKDIRFVIQKIILQFNKNHFLSKLYSKFGIVL